VRVDVDAAVNPQRWRAAGHPAVRDVDFNPANAQSTGVEILDLEPDQQGSLALNGAGR
jgi:hypothetical protein